MDAALAGKFLDCTGSPYIYRIAETCQSGVLAAQTRSPIANHNLPMGLERIEHKDLRTATPSCLIGALPLTLLAGMSGYRVEEIQEGGGCQTGLVSRFARIAAPSLCLVDGKGKYQAGFAPSGINKEATVSMKRKCLQAFSIEVVWSDSVLVVLGLEGCGPRLRRGYV